MTPRSSRTGSVVAVMWVVVILAALGLAAITLSTGLGRRDHHESMRDNAFEAAKAAAEEAALLVNNGKVNVAIDTVLGASNAVEIESPMIDEENLRYMGVPADQKPRITVRSAIISPADLPKKPPLEQLEEIREEIETRGYSADMYTRLKEFWERVDGTDGRGVEGDTEGIRSDALTSSFWNMTGGLDIGSWGPENRVEDIKDANGVVIGQEIKSNNMMAELHTVYELFYDENADKTSGSKTKVPSTGALKPAWEAAMLAVGAEAASRMESCGSNPNLAMSHLVGDLKEGKAIASGTEVSITSAFMQSRELGANKTYLLEINAKMPYGEQAGATKMRGEAEYTTYRLFQKAEWEAAVSNMAESLTRSLLAHGVSPAQIAEMFPPDPTQEGRAVDIPGTTVKYDPKKLLSDLIFKELPSTVGARMYPYSVANAY